VALALKTVRLEIRKKMNGRMGREESVEEETKKQSDIMEDNSTRGRQSALQ